MNPRLVPVVLLVLFSGCGYTIVRDFDAETLQRESAIHDTLTLAPDLIVTELEFEYVPPPPRRDALDIVVQPHRLIVYISIENVGNADFTNPYLLLIRNPTAKPLHIHAPIRLENRKRSIIHPEETVTLTVEQDYPDYGATYSFAIATNPILQKKVITEVSNSVNNPRSLPHSREFRYDNNIAEIIIPPLIEMIKREQQKEK